jgi:plasmid stabilization system protein ParE
MTYRLIVAPEAEAELAGACDWYDERRTGLGRELLSCIDDAMERIQRDPLAFAVTYKNVRQSLVRRFPYVICYTFDGHTVNVSAVFHGHRDPNEWKRRLR